LSPNEFCRALVADRARRNDMGLTTKGVAPHLENRIRDRGKIPGLGLGHVREAVFDFRGRRFKSTTKGKSVEKSLKACAHGLLPVRFSFQPRAVIILFN
jgi:hypothetical protein